MTIFVMEFFAEPVKQITCGKCGRAIDASGAKPLSTTQCPGCGAEVPVPAQFKDFLLLKQLGQGSSGIVFKALDQKLHRQVAVKVLVGKDDDEQAALECIREARTLARLNHRNIVRIYGLDEHQGQHFIVMELLTRGTAGRLIRSSRRPSERRILDLAIAVAGGLDAAHRAGLVHMDIKPENILFNADGIPKLIDFGAAQFRHRSKDEGVVGTPYYIAPETARGRDPDFRSDMYSFGATLFHLLAGRPPFEAEDARSLIARRLTEAAPSVLADRKDVSLRTARIIERLLERDPQHRPGAYDELIEELEQARAVLRVDPDSIDVEDLPAVELAAALGSPMGRSTSARTALSTRTLVAGARPSALGRWLWGSAAFVVLLVGAIAWIVLPGETEPTPVQPPNGPAIAIAPAAPPSPPAAPTTPPTPAPLPPSPPVSPPPPSVPPASALAPVPAARWTFDTTDSTPIGSFSRPANVADGDLVLDGKAHLAIEAIDRDLGERTFEVWVTLGNLDQRAGGVFTVETLNGVVFDGIVYGEKQPGCWISGSDNFRRSQALGGPAETSLEPVHLAITYAADGRISFYRNGEPYGDSYIKGSLVTYRSNEYRLLFGQRHTASRDGHFKGRLHEACLYDRVLDAAEIKRSFAVGFDGKIVPPTKPLDEPGTLVAMGKIVEAEDIEGAPLVDAKWPGFSGTGFVDFQQVSGERLAFAVEASTGGRHQLRLRYALKDSGRDLALIVNGDRTSIHFPSTNTWQAWRTIDFDVALKPSRNVITLETTGQEGPNLDTIQVLSGDTLTRVPDPKETTAGYTLLYDLDLGRLGNSITYDVDNRATAPKKFDRVAYLLELEKSGEQRKFVSVSMSAFTQDPEKLGIPTFSSKAIFQQPVQSMAVVSNLQGLQTGTGLAGNIEFWPNNYSAGNSANVPGASGGAYDIGDSRSGGGNYGCMQVHNTAAKQTVFAINHWVTGRGADIGIGNSTGKTRDWTFTGQADSYSFKRLRVFVRGRPRVEPGVLAWNLGEAKGRSIDPLGDGPKATLSSDAKIADGALVVNETYVDVRGSNVDLAKPYTVSAWVRVKNDGILLSFSSRGEWERQARGLFIYQGRLKVELGGVGRKVGRTQVNDDRWHHLAVRHDAQQFTLFVDGKADGGGAIVARPLPSPVIRLGGRQGRGPESAFLMYNFRIDPQALSDEALADLAASRPDRMPAPVVGLPSGPEPPVAGKGEPGKAFTYFMNVGGEQFRDKTGRIWSKGQVFRDGGHGWQGGRAIKVNNPNQVIGSCVVDLQAVRLTVPDGNYRLTLVFCDQWANRVGERRFDLSIEGKAVHRGFDPLRVAGGKGRIFVKRLPRIAVRDGRLDIEFSGKGRMISGVGVEQILPAKSQGLSGSAELAGAVSQRREAAGAKALEAAKALLKTNETDGFDALRNLALRHRGTGAAAEATETMDAIKQDTGRYTRIRKALEERDARKQLAICKQYIVINKPEVASRELRKLIKDYGQTSVADEARLLLHGLEQQRQR